MVRVNKVYYCGSKIISDLCYISKHVQHIWPNVTNNGNNNFWFKELWSDLLLLTLARMRRVKSSEAAMFFVSQSEITHCNFDHYWWDSFLFSTEGPTWHSEKINCFTSQESNGKCSTVNHWKHNFLANTITV